MAQDLPNLIHFQENDMHIYAVRHNMDASTASGHLMRFQQFKWIDGNGRSTVCSPGMCVGKRKWARTDESLLERKTTQRLYGSSRMKRNIFISTYNRMDERHHLDALLVYNYNQPYFVRLLLIYDNRRHASRFGSYHLCACGWLLI